MNNTATARGLMTILLRLAERSVVSAGRPTRCSRSCAARSSTRAFRPACPPGTSVAHKTGSFRGVYHDAAIVEPPGRKPYVLVVLTRGIVDESRAHRLVSEIRGRLTRTRWLDNALDL